jgi:hypothetical protein
MFFTPKWEKMIPKQTRPGTAKLEALEEIRINYGIPHEYFAMGILSNPAMTKRTQLIVYENFKKQYPKAPDKEILTMVLTSRIASQARLREDFDNISIKTELISEVMESISSIDELIAFIIDNEPSHIAAKESEVGRLIFDVLEEDN